MTPFQLPNIKGHFGHDAQRASRVYHFANSQPTWAARMAAFILSTLILLLVLVILLPLLLLVLVVIAGVILVARVRLAFSGSRAGGRFTKSPTSVGSRGAGRKNVRVREPRED